MPLNWQFATDWSVAECSGTKISLAHIYEVKPRPDNSLAAFTS
jgi:hypothetical protein